MEIFNMFGIEHFILLVASIVAIYVLAHPTNKKTKKVKAKNKIKETEIRPKGLPSSSTNIWFDPNYNDPRYF